MDVTVATFRADFPAFAEATVYPDSSVQFWITLASRLLRPCAWQDILDTGIELFVAHNLVLERLASNGGNGGGVPGINTGVLQSKTIDKLSVTYNTTMGIDPNGGQFNLTLYGLRFLWLSDMAGMAPTQVSAGSPVPNYTPWIVGGLLGSGWPYA